MEWIWDKFGWLCTVIDTEYNSDTHTLHSIQAQSFTKKTFWVVLFSSDNFAKIKVNIFEWFFLDTNVDFVNVKLIFL